MQKFNQIMIKQFQIKSSKGSCLLQVSNDWKIGIISQRNDQFVDHKSKDSEHGSTAVVQFDGALLKLGFFIKVFPSVVEVSVAEVTWELGACSWNLAHDGALKNTDQGNELHNSGGGDVVLSDDGSNSVGERVEGISGVVDVSWKVDSGTSGDLTEEGQHTDASVLQLDVTKTFQSLLGGITGEHTERIVESKWWLHTKLFLEGTQGGGLGGLLGRCERTGSGDKGCKDGGLHGEIC